MNKVKSQRYGYTPPPVAHYHYSGLGHRVAKEVGNLDPKLPDRTTLNLSSRIEDVLDITKDYNNLLERQVDGTNITYLWGEDILAATQDKTTKTYLTDYLGSPLRFGSDSFAFDEFGQTLSGNFSPSQPFGFTGYQQDDIANTYYGQAREYMPENGRFNSEDIVKGVVSTPQTQNPYTYCFNAPLAFSDKDGLTPKVVLLAPLAWKGVKAGSAWVGKTAWPWVAKTAWPAVKTWTTTKAWPWITTTAVAASNAVVAQAQKASVWWNVTAKPAMTSAANTVVSAVTTAAQRTSVAWNVSVKPAITNTVNTTIARAGNVARSVSSAAGDAVRRVVTSPWTHAGAAGAIYGIIESGIETVVTGEFSARNTVANTISGTLGGLATFATRRSSVGVAVSQGSNTLIRGVWDFADGTTPLNAENIARLAGRTAVDSGAGAVLGNLASRLAPFTRGFGGRGGLSQSLAEGFPAFALEAMMRGVRSSTPDDFFKNLIQSLAGSQTEFSRSLNRCR